MNEIDRRTQAEIRAVQLKRVWQLLAETDLKMDRIAELVGFEHPEYLRINARGQMLFTGEPGVEFASGELASTAKRVWVWDGREAHEFPREDERETARSRQRSRVKHRALAAVGASRLGHTGGRALRVTIR